MKVTLRKIILLAICAVMLFSFTACADIETLLEIEDASETEEVIDNKTYSTAGGPDIVLPEDFVYPELANRITGMILPESDVYVATIYLSQYRSDSYLFINGNSLTLNANFYLTDSNGQSVDSHEDYRDVKVVLWEKGVNNAKYVQTVHFTGDGTNQSYTFTNLKSGGEYRISITYSDYWAYYVNGNFMLSSISGEGSEEETLAEE